MLTRIELLKISKARLRDSEILFEKALYDGAIYLCGYALEIRLKLRICKTLGWTGFPSTRAEFENFQSFKTHKLDILLKLTGFEDKIKRDFLAEWSIVAAWDPEVRYKPIGTVTKNDAYSMIQATRILLRVL